MKDSTFVDIHLRATARAPRQPTGSLGRGFASLLLTGALTSCASVESIQSTDLSKHHGITYRLPMQWFVATLTVQDRTRTLTLSKSAAFGDPSTLYVARVPTNQFSTTAAKIQVTRDGLLDQDTTAEITSKLPDILVELGNAAGVLRRNAFNNFERLRRAPETDACAEAGTYTWVIDPENPSTTEQEAKACGVNWEVTSVRSATPVTGASAVKSSSAGFFYRQAVPYLLRLSLTNASGVTRTQTYLESVPTSDSPTAFLPLHRTAFAHNKALITFAHGTPTSVGYDQDSEWLAVAKLPAAIVGGYVGGIKSGFEGRKAALVAEKDYLAALSLARAQEAKSKACLLELSKPAPDAALVAQLCQ